MQWYGICQYCPVDGERVKSLPFGNEDGLVLFVLPSYLVLDAEAQREYTEAYPQAYFVHFAACANVLDVAQADLTCSIILRNTALKFYKILIGDYAPLKKLFGVTSEGVVKEDGTQIVIYRGRPLEKSAQEEYKRLV